MAPEMTDQLGMLNRAYVHQRRVCVTGRLVCLTHAQLGELVEASGGSFIRFPTQSSIILVVGDGGLPAERDGTPSRVFERARQLKARGYRIDFVSEDEFLERIGLAASANAIRSLHTIADLSRILDIPVARLRHWVHLGLIEPTETQFHLDYFDMQQVSLANRVAELAEGGTSLNAVRRGFQDLEAFLPGERSPLDRIARMQRSGQILVRVDGRLIDTDGQRHFDFDTTDEATATLPGRTYSTDQQVHDLLVEALDSENAGNLSLTLTTYHRALRLAPNDPILHYNLGNVLFADERAGDAAASYERALEIDPKYIEAWNNLGNAYAAQLLWNDAAGALRNAIELLPTYADAHFNLAAICRRLGNPKQAAVHQAAYDRHSSAARMLAERKHLMTVFRGDEEDLG